MNDEANIDLAQFCSKTEQDEELILPKRVEASKAREEVGFDLKGNGITGLFNKSEPALYLQREKYYHRIVAYLKAEGKSNVEIAEEVGCTPPTIAYLVKQPFMEQMILEAIVNRGGDRVEQFLNEQVMPSLEFYVKIRDDSEQATANRLKANEALLDRKFGKPNQPVQVTRRQDLTQKSDEELARIAGHSTETATSK